MQLNNQIKVWDPLIRLFHWTLVTAFIITWLTEDELLNLHVYSGYLILALLLIRLLWGFVGTRYARFSNFVRSPGRAMNYLKDLIGFSAKRHIGHNPAGGLMIITLMLSLLCTALTGVATYGVEGFGPLAGWLHSYGIWNDNLLEEFHEYFANFTLFLVVIHLAGVLLGSLIHNENLIRAMFTGVKKV